MFLLGLATCLVFFLLLGIGFYFGTRYRPKPEVPQLSESEKQQMERIKKGFADVMNYTVEKARG